MPEGLIGGSFACQILSLLFSSGHMVQLLLRSNAGYVNRIAWFYGTKGPSMCIDTEESSGAAAMDTALNYGREDRCSKAVVCSTQLIQHPVTLIVCCVRAMGQLSATGRGRAFDESADGVVRSEGLRLNCGLICHAPEVSKDVFVGGQHHPTIVRLHSHSTASERQRETSLERFPRSEVVVNHREPHMQMPPSQQPPGPKRRISDVPLQPFQDIWCGSMNHLQSYQMQMLLRPGDVAIDVGANLGCYTVALAEETVRVLRLDDLLLDPEKAQSWALPLVQDVRLIKHLGQQRATL
eukprot:s673_g14.t1